MQRRQVVRALALVTAGMAGCSEAPSPTPEPPTGTPGVPPDDGNVGGFTTRQPLRVGGDYTLSAGPNGQVRLDATVTNPARVDRVATLVVHATLDGNDTTVRKHLNLASGESTSVSVLIGFDYTDWQDGSKSLDFTFEYV
ncbi:MAG: hypothetical protein ABEI77_10135 [Halorientalis sp.]